MYLKIMQHKSTILGLILVAGFCYLVYLGASGVWYSLKSIDPKLAVTLVTAATTLFAATLTIVIGKYFERKKEIESHFRPTKVKIYDEFLDELFKVFHGNNESDNPSDLTTFLQEWQRAILMNGGANVMTAYLKFMAHLKKLEPDAKCIFLIGELCLAMRKDVGLSNYGLEKETFAQLILRHPELFMEEVKNNPNITLDELSEIEKERGLESD